MKDEQIVEVPRVPIEQVDFLSKTKEILREIKKTGNFDAGFQFVKSLNEMGSTFDRAKSIMLEGMDKVWKPEKHEGETFLQATVRLTGLHPVTIVRHTKNERLLNSGIIPDVYKESIETSGEKSLVQIANVVDAGFELEDKDWRSLAEASGDDRKVGRIVRKIKGVAPRSNFYAITLDERGVLVGHTKDAHVELGRLNVDSDNPIVQKGISRLTGCSGVLPSVEY